jgi:hypothetical protein
MVGKTFLFVGIAMVVAAAVKATLDMLRAETFDVWSAVLAVGCIFVSIGLGITKSEPWKKIEEVTSRLGRSESDEK